MDMRKELNVSALVIENKIFNIWSTQVMLDKDLSEMSGV